MDDLSAGILRFLSLTSIQVLLLAAAAAAALRLGRARGTFACGVLLAVLILPLLSPLGALLPDRVRVAVPLAGLAESPAQALPDAEPVPTMLPAPEHAIPEPVLGTSGPGPVPLAPETESIIVDGPAAMAAANIAASAPTGSGIGWRSVVLIVWAAVVALLSIRIIRGVAAHRRLLRKARPVADRDVLALLERCAEEAGTAPPRLLASPDPIIPFVRGAFRPVVVLPARLLEPANREGLRFALLHELGHVRWHHALWIAPEILLRTVFFFHPLLLWAVRRFREEREYVCDRLAAKIAGRTSRYAAFLLDELRNASGARSVPATALGFRGNRMHVRVQRLIEDRRTSMTGTARKVAVLGMFFAALAGVVALTPVTAGAEEGSAEDRFDISVAWSTPLLAPSFGESAVADVDGDGRLEVAFGTYFGDGSVRVLNGEDGSHYWRYAAGNACLDASLRFADLDDDGDLELVVPVSNQGSVLALDLKRGEEQWRYSPAPVECTDSPPAILDFDGDGQDEVLYGTFKGRVHVIDRDGKGKRVLSVCDHYIQTGPAVLDLDGDGTLDFVCATFKGDNAVYGVSGKSGETLWRFQVPGKHIGMYHGCSVGDLDGDGVPELVIGAYNGTVYCLRPSTGEVIWEAAPGDRFFMSPTAIADLDGDGKPEVLTASERVSVLDGKGKVLWSKPCGKGGWDSATRGVSVADLDGDRVLDVVTLSGGGWLMVHRGSDGKLLYEFDAATISKSPLASSSHGVTIADLTGDGRLDLFFVVGATRPEKHGLAICLTGFEGRGRGWYMLRHDVRNTGNRATAHDPVLLKHIEGLKPARSPVMSAPDFRQEPPPPVRKPIPSRPPRPGPRKVDYTRAFDLAAERGISKEVMEAVIATHRMAVSSESLEKVEEIGGPAFVAGCILIEAGNGSIYTLRTLHRCWQVGLEQILFDLIEREDVPNYGSHLALAGLGAADTPRVRKYLLERIGKEREALWFMQAALALGDLKETRAVESIGEQLFRFENGWSGVEKWLVSALGRMEDETANAWLVRYLADPRAKQHFGALLGISLSDRALAAKEARSLLASGRTLNKGVRKVIESYLPRWESE